MGDIRLGDGVVGSIGGMISTVNREPIETARRKFFQVFEQIISLLGIVDIKKAIIEYGPLG